MTLRVSGLQVVKALQGMSDTGIRGPSHLGRTQTLGSTRGDLSLSLHRVEGLVPGVKHRLAAQSFRFLQLHPQVEHLEVIVVVPHHRLNLGPAQLPQQLQTFLSGVIWLSLEELGQQAEHDPILTLLTLPVLPKPDIPGATEQILQPRPDLLEPVVSILGERFPYLTRKEIMALINLPTDHLRDTRFSQELLAEGRLEGRLEGEARGRAAEAAAMGIRQLNRRCGPLSPVTTAHIQALPLQELEALAEALLDCSWRPAAPDFVHHELRR